MTAPAAHQSLFCHQSLVHLPAAQVDTEQLQSMTSACGSMTGNIKAKKKKQQSDNFFPVLKAQSVLLRATRENGKTGNSGWKIKWFTPSCLESFRKCCDLR